MIGGLLRLWGRLMPTPPAPPAALTITQGEQLPATGRRGRRPVTLVVLHESVTTDRASCLRVLRQRGLSVHYTVERDGTVEQHAPLVRACWHAGAARNTVSVAIEVISRYYGAHAGPGEDTIRAVWADKGSYILPTEDQCEAVWQLVQHVAEAQGVAVAFPGAAGESFRWGRVDGVTAGVSAHHRWAHADALYPEHYCWARWHGLTPEQAWAATVSAAASGQRVTTLDTTEARA